MIEYRGFTIYGAKELHKKLKSENPGAMPASLFIYKDDETPFSIPLTWEELVEKPFCFTDNFADGVIAGVAKVVIDNYFDMKKTPGEFE